MSKKKLLKSTAIVGGFTLISRILGFIRDVVIAHTFGASVSTDAFLVAFKIPNFMRRLFAEGAFSQAFTPVLSEYKTLRDTNAVKLLVSYVAGNLGSVLLILTLLGIVIAPVFVFIFAPGFIQYQEKYELTVAMLRITFPYLLFIALTAFAGAILNTYGRFAIPALTPVLLNICLISGALWFTSYFQQPIMALAWAVLIAGILQLAFQLPFLYQLHLLPKPRINWHDEGVQRINQLMIPALFGVSVSQINLLIDTLMASFLVTGSVSWLYYSDRLMEFPVGVFGLALATVT
jgi:putative peptidoglycan lipid II flippase